MCVGSYYYNIYSVRAAHILYNIIILIGTHLVATGIFRSLFLPTTSVSIVVVASSTGGSSESRGDLDDAVVVVVVVA